MAISRKSAAEFALDIEKAISARNANYDTKVGPIPDLYIQPTANVLELQNDRIRRVQQLLSMQNDGSFSAAELDDIVFNESMLRLAGGKAIVNLIFSRATLPTTDITVKANFPVATLADETTGVTVTFLTLIDTTLSAANAASYFNSDTQKYELMVPARAVSGTEIGNVGANRIIRPLRPLSGFDSVFNRDASSGGMDLETNDDLISRYFISLTGSSPTVVDGIQKRLRDQFPTVQDSNVVYGNNALNVRSATDGGAVDVYVSGSYPTTITENIIFSGVNQVIPLVNQPLISIVSAGSYVQDTDFSLVKDTSGYAASIKASDGLRWLPTGTAPTVGSVVVVTYIYNSLIGTLQDAFASDKLVDPARDLLFKAATQVDTTLTANIKIRSGYNVATAVAAISSAIATFINQLTLADAVEGSDLQLIVRAFTSVDNFVITNLSRVGSTGTADISIGANEFPRIAIADIALVVI